MFLPHGVAAADDSFIVQKPLVYLRLFLTALLQFAVVLGLWGASSVLTHTHIFSHFPTAWG